MPAIGTAASTGWGGASRRWSLGATLTSLVLAGLALAGCAVPQPSAQTPVAARTARPQPIAPQRTVPPGAPGVRPGLPQGEAPPIRLTATPRPVGAGQSGVFEYTDLSLTGGSEAMANAKFGEFQRGVMRCVNVDRRSVPNDAAATLVIRQTDPFSGTRFVLRCRGACDGMRFTVQAGGTSDYSVADGTQAGYPLIEMRPPRMAMTRDQGVTVWRGPDAPAGQATVELLQLTRNPVTTGGGCR